jgi:outer membrane immunogenic protein
MRLRHRSTISLVALCAVLGLLSSAVMAADLGGPRGRSLKDSGSMKEEGYHEPAPFTWTGFYIGAHIGGAWANFDVRNTPEGNGNAFDEGSPGSQYKLEPESFIGGFQAGYNRQYGAIVYGIEADVSFASGRDSLRLETVPPDDFARAKIGTFGTVTARLGYAAGRWMPYVKGGLAFGEVRVNAGDLDGTGTGAVDLTDETSKSATRTGWTVGAGLEWAMTNNWTLKTEYNYIDLGKFKSSNEDGDVFKHAVDTHVVKLGVNYKF